MSVTAASDATSAVEDAALPLPDIALLPPAPTRPRRRRRSCSSISTRPRPPCKPRPQESLTTPRYDTRGAATRLSRDAGRIRSERSTQRCMSACSPASLSAARARSAAPSTRTAHPACTCTKHPRTGGTASAANATATLHMTSRASCGNSKPGARISLNSAGDSSSSSCLRSLTRPSARITARTKLGMRASLIVVADRSLRHFGPCAVIGL